MWARILQWGKENKVVLLVVFVYIFAMISVIGWGIPNETHPFNYHMDEWHQLQAVRALFKHGTPNVSGAANGSIFQFFLTGIYLIPFVILGVIQPFSVHSSMDNLQMQEKIFIVLRLNTLLFGVLSILLIAIIARKYLKITPFVSVFFFTVTPLWIVLSNYFKYDIALTFWILLSLFFILRYGEKPTLKNFLLAAIPCALAFATKVAALPQLLLYGIAFFYFTPNFTRKYKQLAIGIVFCSLLAIFAGIPDIIFRFSNYQQYLSSNISTASQKDTNFLIGSIPTWVYTIGIQFPRIFGYGFFLLATAALVYGSYLTVGEIFLKREKNKPAVFIIISLVVYSISLIPLGLGATGNRLLVVLPFLALLIGVLFERVKSISTKTKYTWYALFIVCGLLQMIVSYFFLSAKYTKAPVQVSSEWVLKNIPKGSYIGIENTPIYHSVPDFVLKDYYLKQENRNYHTYFSYQIIDATTKKLPKYVILSDTLLNRNYLKLSSTKELIKRLEHEKYKSIAYFPRTHALQLYLGNELNIYLSGLIAATPVTIYKRP